jgi:hypothetical protein
MEMKRILAVALVLFAFYHVKAEEQKLSQAYEQQLIEKVKSVFSPEAKPVELERPICATPIFLEVKANWDRLSAKAKGSLKAYVERPSYSYPEFVYNTLGGHFKVHYTREGDNAVYNPDLDYNSNGHPDWIDTVGMVLDHVWEAEVSGLEYYPPPSDGDYPDTMDNGGDGKYDVYILNIAFLGYTQGERFSTSGPYQNSATSYIVLDNDYPDPRHTRLQWLEVTAAHEFFHAIQMGYDGLEYESDTENVKPYWMEMSAVWMEDMVYDQVNDYVLYLPEFFNYPWLSLKTYRSLSDLHAYGSCVWALYLQERFSDTTIIKEIWQRCGEVPGPNVLNPDGQSAIDKTLEGRGLTFEEAFREFTVWNYFTGNRARTQTYYSEGDLFPQVKVDTMFHYHTVYPVNTISGPFNPQNLGSDYVVFVPDPNLTQGGMRLEFTSLSGEYKVTALGHKSYPFPPYEITVTGLGKIYNWQHYSEIVMVPAVVTRSPDGVYQYEYIAEYDSSLYGDETLPEEDKILQNFPNPFVIEDGSDRTFFPFILSSPSRVQIDIFTLSGERIKTIIPRYDTNLGRAEYLDQALLRELDMFWDGKNEDGEYVSAGVYVYSFRTERTTEVKKIAVIR